MFERLRRGGAVAAALALAIAGFGATPALAEDDAVPYDPDKAVLTKVIDAPAGTDASQDKYVFHFAGGGTVIEDGDDLISDGVVQNKATIKADDTVPTIPDVTLNGVQLTTENTLSNGQVAQAVVQKSITDILEGVEFPHAGVYTYVVTEKSVSLSTANADDAIYANASQAEYTLRIRVSNTHTTTDSLPKNRDLTIESVTLEQTKDDNGNALYPTEKIDPTYPTTTTANKNKIDQTAEGVTPGPNELAGDDRGRMVPGFTFANEYIMGGSFQVKKLYDGTHSDRTKYSLVELAIYSAAAANPDAHGACLTYLIEGDGIDMTEYNQDSDGERRKLNGVKQDIPQNNHYMATFNDSGWAYLKAELKEDSVIRVTGEFGPYNAEYENQNEYGNRRMVLSTSGLLNGQTKYVIERDPGDYEPTGYEYVGTDENADPRVSSNGMTATQKLTTPITDPTDLIPNEYENNPDAYHKKTIEEGSLVVQGSATGSATTVFVVNTINESAVSPTGILIENLPYILMVGIPVAVFAGMFVMKRRGNAAA
ncbi:MAG: hypothetical protein IKG22_14535 [Atopobiaceae bacterium]|nr:hypothetical protein [Atopobiaceae bacterium]